MTRYEAIEKAAIDVANDLEAELNAKYPASVREFPCMQKDFDGDMQSVISLHAALALPEDDGDTEVRLFDSQWVNIVNHSDCYYGMSKEDAISKAVKLTEAAMAENFKDRVWPKPRKDSKVVNAELDLPNAELYSPTVAIEWISEVFPEWTTLQIMANGTAFAFNRVNGKVYKIPDPNVPFIQMTEQYKVIREGDKVRFE